MREVGFFLGRTKYGTIAYKQDNINKIPLDDRALGLLDTRAGIPFYDSNLSSSKEEILSKCSWSPFEGECFNWSIAQTWVNGQCVYADGKITDDVRGRAIRFNR